MKFQDFSVVQTLGCGFSEHSLYTSLTFGVTLLVSEACLADPHSQKLIFKEPFESL